MPTRACRRGISAEKSGEDPLFFYCSRRRERAALAAWLSQGEDIRHLEQEALDPISPLTKR
jgi:hypothetical protein